MNNDITIDVKATLALPDNSITDAETCRQIGLATTKRDFLSREDSNLLGRKIARGYEYAALYPHIIPAFDSIVAKNITAEGQKMLKELMKIREDFKSGKL